MTTPFQQLLPPDVMVEESDDLAAVQGVLLGGEVHAVKNAAAVRRREFVAGRTLARRALTRLGIPPTPLGIGSRREPLWPPGVVGSVTHTRTYCAVAVARADRVAAVGIDAEVRRPLPGDVAGMVLTSSEVEMVRGLPLASRAPWDTVVFSAKEALYKAWFVAAGATLLRFSDATMTIDARNGTLAAAVVDPGGPAGMVRLEGRFAIDNGLIFTAFCLPLLSI